MGQHRWDPVQGSSRARGQGLKQVARAIELAWAYALTGNADDVGVAAQTFALSVTNPSQSSLRRHRRHTGAKLCGTRPQSDPRTEAHLRALMFRDACGVPREAC